MKTTLLTLILNLAIFIAQSAVLRVNSDLNVDAPYRTIQSAIDAAAIDDTVLVEPSVIHYAGYTCSKKVHVIGSFARNHLPKSYAQNTKSWVNSVVSYLPGSEGSVIMGLTLWDPDISLNTNMYLSASELVLKRNSIRELRLRSKNMLNVADTTHVDNCLIIQNYIYYFLTEKNAHASSVIYANNIVLKNNIFDNYFYLYDNYLYVSSDISNNIFINSNIYAKNANIYNNIFTSSTYDYIFYSSYNNVVSYNVFNRATPTCGTCIYDVGNQFGVDMAGVFASLPVSSPPYTLSATSQAKDSGVSGDDCGIYGGAYPFIHGVTSDIPAIYYFMVRPVSNTQVEFEVKAAVRP